MVFAQSGDGGAEGRFGARDEGAAVDVEGEEVRDCEADASGAAGYEDVRRAHWGGDVVWDEEEGRRRWRGGGGDWWDVYSCMSMLSESVLISCAIVFAVKILNNVRRDVE